MVEALLKIQEEKQATHSLVYTYTSSLVKGVWGNFQVGQLLCMAYLNKLDIYNWVKRIKVQLYFSGLVHTSIVIAHITKWIQLKYDSYG